MKLTTKILAGAVALAFVTLTAGSLQADEGTITNVVSIAFVAAGQNSTTDKDGVSTTAAPITRSANTADVLSWLAVDENEEGNYTAGSTFPTGAKLVVIGGDGNALDFQVLSKSSQFLVDVSDILTFTNSGTFGSDVQSGKQNDDTELADPTQTDQEVFTLTYNDLSSTGDVQFSFTGVLKNVTTDTTPKDGVYKETQSHTISGGQGDGAYLGHEATVTGGSFKASGSGELSEP